MAAIEMVSIGGELRAATIRQAQPEKARDNPMLEIKLGENGKEKILTNSQVFIDEIKKAERYAAANVPVLITGETGTGKELIAKLIHQERTRSNRQANWENFVAVQISATASNLLESELFGHKKGSFTGALVDKEGFFKKAHNGSLFFDEIGDLPLDLQVKLLRCFNHGIHHEFYPVGSTMIQTSLCKIICATNQNLEILVKEKKFRSDLFFRLGNCCINLPPLRERKEDIALLAEYYAQQFCCEKKLPEKSISQEAMDLLLDYSWPGNVRELIDMIEISVINSGEKETIEEVDFSSNKAFINQSKIKITLGNFQATIEEVEKNIIIEALKKCNGVQTRAADYLGLSRRIIKYKMDRYGIKLLSDGELNGKVGSENFPIPLTIISSKAAGYNGTNGHGQKLEKESLPPLPATITKPSLGGINGKGLIKGPTFFVQPTPTIVSDKPTDPDNGLPRVNGQTVINEKNAPVVKQSVTVRHITEALIESKGIMTATVGYLRIKSGKKWDTKKLRDKMNEYGMKILYSSGGFAKKVLMADGSEISLNKESK